MPPARTPRKAPKRAAPRGGRRPPALGNDPFVRGAAPREGEAPAASVEPPSIEPRSTPEDAAPPPLAPAAPPAGAGLPEMRSEEEPRARAADPGAGRVVAAVSAAASRLAEIERWLESALEGVEARGGRTALHAGIAAAEGELREAVKKVVPAVRARLATAGDLVRLLEPPERLDRHGMDARFAERIAPIVELLYAIWWRVEVRGIASVPSSGPALVVANHAGVIPWDAFVLRHALRRDHPAHRELRPLLDDRECALPIIGPLAIRAGAVRASAEAAERILAAGDLVGVFPEGSTGARKPWRDRYRIQRFGRGGFAKLALRCRAPIVPCAIVGSEEASPGISRTGWLAEHLGMPLLSAAPALRLPAAALLPLPSRWSLRFAAPIEAPQGPEASDDPAVVNELTERVRSAIQAMLDEDLAARASVFL